jgi:hypothetical protein
MGEIDDSQMKWLDERFNHIKTILSTIQATMAELKEMHGVCVQRCNNEMEGVYQRLRQVEHQQAAKDGAEEHERKTREAENLTWQMIIAFGTALSAMGAFAGYFIGRGQ